METIHYTVDGEPQMTTHHELTAAQILEKAGKNPTNHYLVLLEGHKQKSFEGKPDEIIQQAHIASPGKRCLECLEQYDPALVQAEREGRLDDPVYIQGLPEGHVLRNNQNVFAFSLGLASLEILQMLMMVVSPLGISDIGEQMFHMIPGILDVKRGTCHSNCFYQTIVSKGDLSGITVI